MNLLDGIGENHPADSAIDAVIWDRMRTSWPAHDSTKITYAWIVQNYEAEKINKLMKEIAGLFSENGGNDFYYDKLVYENGFRERVFSKLIKDVLSHRKGMPNVQLCQYGQRILAVWQLAENKIDASFEEALAQDVKKTIINRALLEYCKDTAIYFRDVYNTKAELQSGAYNGFQNILHPIETATSLMKGLGLAGTPQEQRETQIRMLEHVAAHPTGVTTEICVTTAPVTGPLTWYFGPSVVRSIGYGVGALAIGAHLAANVMRNNRP